MKKETSILDMSEYLIIRFQIEGIPLTPLKLQKILYYIQAWHLVFFDKKPLFDDQVEAWVNGPVYKKVYDTYKNDFKVHEPILLPLSENDLAKNLESSNKKLNLSPEEQEFLEAIIQRYGYMSPEKLVMLSHSEKPWNEARKGLMPFQASQNIISLESMFEYYNSKKVVKANENN
jgi:uncharacterized phage-associated protein